MLERARVTPHQQVTSPVAVSGDPHVKPREAVAPSLDLVDDAIDVLEERVSSTSSTQLTRACRAFKIMGVHQVVLDLSKQYKLTCNT